MVKKVFIRIIQVTFILLFALQPQTLFAAEAEEACNEARLRNLGIAMIGCKENPVSNSGGCGTGSTLAGNDNKEKTWYYLIGKGFTPVQAAGAMGNLQHEGGFNPKRVEGGHMEGTKWLNASPLQFPAEMDTLPPSNLAPLVPGKYAGQPGYGIVQWTTPSRKTGLGTFASSKNLPVYDLGVQLDYMWSELEGPYKDRVLTPLMATTDLAEAVRIWQEKYEVGTRFQPRYEAAQGFLTQYGSGTPTPSTGGGCQLDASGCPQQPISQNETVDASGIRVHQCIADEVNRIMALAKQQGLSTFKGGGYRDSAGQIEARKRNGCPDIYESPPSSCKTPTARPGTSNHERGTAVDFECDGNTFSSRSHPCYKFLEENTKLKNLPSEAWHWSIDGG